MTWILGLSVAPSGVGAAVARADGSPHVIGFFPEVDRAVRVAAESESTPAPDSAVLVVPAALSDYDLKWYLGELVIAGVPSGTVQVRSDAEVLQAAYGGPILLADADRDVIVAPTGGTEPLDAVRLAEILDEDPADTTVVLVGHPEVRGSVHAAVADLEPVLVDRPQIAALALAHPTTGSLVSRPEPSAGESVPSRTPGAPVLVLILLFAAALIVAVSLLF